MFQKITFRSKFLYRASQKVVFLSLPKFQFLSWYSRSFKKFFWVFFAPNTLISALVSTSVMLFILCVPVALVRIKDDNFIFHHLIIIEKDTFDFPLVGLSLLRSERFENGDLWGSWSGSKAGKLFRKLHIAVHFLPVLDQLRIQELTAFWTANSSLPLTNTLLNGLDFLNIEEIQKLCTVCNFCCYCCVLQRLLW